jgi:hypothetical protein
VTKNCKLALCYLRKEESGRVLWVDAICINQKDDKERGHQVGMMRDVYSKATEVLIWLGEASKDLGSSDPVTQSLDDQVLHSTSSTRLSSEAMIEHEHKPGNTHSAESARSSAGGLIPVSDLSFDYLHRMVAEIRALRRADKGLGLGLFVMFFGDVGLEGVCCRIRYASYLQKSSSISHQPFHMVLC